MLLYLLKCDINKHGAVNRLAQANPWNQESDCYHPQLSDMKKPPWTVNVSKQTHTHRWFKPKRTYALCTGDLRTVHFNQEAQRHEQKTAHSGLATTGKSWKGQESNPPSTVTMKGLCRRTKSSIPGVFSIFIGSFCKFLFFHDMIWAGAPPAGEGEQTPRLLPGREENLPPPRAWAFWTGFSSRIIPYKHPNADGKGRVRRVWNQTPSKLMINAVWL